MFSIDIVDVCIWWIDKFVRFRFVDALNDIVDEKFDVEIKEEFSVPELGVRLIGTKMEVVFLLGNISRRFELNKEMLRLELNMVLLLSGIKVDGIVEILFLFVESNVEFDTYLAVVENISKSNGGVLDVCNDWFVEGDNDDDDAITNELGKMYDVIFDEWDVLLTFIKVSFLFEDSTDGDGDGGVIAEVVEFVILLLLPSIKTPFVW